MLPTQESCASTEDENCDGFDCGIWAELFTGNGGVGESVATDAQGNVFNVGHFSSTIQFGKDTFTTRGSRDAFISAFNELGVYRWGRQFGDKEDQKATAVITDANGDLIFAGVNSGTINLGGPDIGPGLFVAKFTNNGSHIWSKGFTGSFSDDMHQNPRLAATAKGDIVLAATFSGSAQFETTSPTSNSASKDIIVTKLAASDGSIVQDGGSWVEQFGGAGDDYIAGIAVDSNGSIVLAGGYGDGIQLPHSSPFLGTGMFITKLDSNNAPGWNQAYSHAQPAALAVDKPGHIIVSGSYTGTVSFDRPLPSGRATSFVVQFSSSGIPQWSRTLTSSLALETRGIATDKDDNIIATGDFLNTADLGFGPMDAGSSADVFVCKIRNDGKALWSRDFGDWGYTKGVTVDPSNEVFIVGAALGGLDFGTGKLNPAPGSETAFLAKLGL